jgi:hypothetical protein
MELPYDYGKKRRIFSISLLYQRKRRGKIQKLARKMVKSLIKETEKSKIFFY